YFLSVIKTRLPRERRNSSTFAPIRVTTFMKSLTLMHRDVSLRTRYGLAMALFVIALLLRFLLIPVDGGFPFITLYPATVAALYFLGIGPGVLVAAFSALVGCYVFLPPHWAFSPRINDYYIVCIYLIGSILTAVALHRLQCYAQSLHRTLAQLQDSESRFRSFMDSSNFIAWMKSEDGHYVYRNKPHERRFNMAPGSGLHKTDFDLFPSALAATLRESDRKVLESGAHTVVEEIIEGIAGDTTHWLSTKFPYTDTGGNRYVGGLALDITERKAAEMKIESLAFYDPLTNLPNRRLLQDRLTQVLHANVRHRRLGALLFIDLDNFKTLNDTYGHILGDLLLHQVAQRLSGSIRKNGTLARLGGDEFVILLEDLRSDAAEAAAQARCVGEKVLSLLGQPYHLDDIAHRSTPSIGITLFGDVAESIDEPLRRADLAMYQAKAAGRNTVRFF